MAYWLFGFPRINWFQSAGTSTRYGGHGFRDSDQRGSDFYPCILSDVAPEPEACEQLEFSRIGILDLMHFFSALDGWKDQRGWTR